jgi:hypothetical protein
VSPWCIVVVETKKEPNKYISIIEMKEKEKYLPLAQTTIHVVWATSSTVRHPVVRGWRVVFVETKKMK